MNRFSSHRDRENAIALHYCVERRIPSEHTSEHRVVPVEVWLRRMRDEILAATGVRSGQCHSESTALVAPRIHLIPDGVARTSVSIVAWIAILRDEIRHDTMKPRSPVVTGARQVHEI